jgi:polar amino acid transport system substrate-binding protein
MTDAALPRCLRPSRFAQRCAMGAALALTVMLMACASTEQRSTWERVQRTGIVRVGYAVEAPFALVDSTGRVSGESPEVLRLVMAKLGVDSIEWVATDFGSLILELQRGDFDVVAAGMYITPERAQSVLFSRPTLEERVALLVRRPDTAQLPSLDAFVADRRRRLAVIAGAAEEGLALAAGLDPDQLRMVPDPATGRAAVRAGEADAFALSTVSLTLLQYTRGDSTDLAVMPLRFPDDPAIQAMSLGRPAYALRHDDTSFRDAINGALATVLGTPAHRAVQRRFGIDSLVDTQVTGRPPFPAATP